METSISADKQGAILRYLVRTGSEWSWVYIDTSENTVLCYGPTGSYNFRWHAPGRDFVNFLTSLSFDYAMSKFIGAETEVDVDRSIKYMRERICTGRREETYTAEAAREMWEAVAEAEKYSRIEFANRIENSAFARHAGYGQWYEYLCYFHGHQARHFWNLIWRPLMTHLAVPRVGTYGPNSTSPLAPIYQSLHNIEQTLQTAGLMPTAEVIIVNTPDA